MSKHRLWRGNGYAPYWDEELETMSREKLKELQPMNWFICLLIAAQQESQQLLPSLGRTLMIGRISRHAYFGLLV